MCARQVKQLTNDTNEQTHDSPATQTLTKHTPHQDSLALTRYTGTHQAHNSPATLLSRHTTHQLHRHSQIPNSADQRPPTVDRRLTSHTGTHQTHASPDSRALTGYTGSPVLGGVAGQRGQGPRRCSTVALFGAFAEVNGEGQLHASLQGVHDVTFTRQLTSRHALHVDRKPPARESVRTEMAAANVCFAATNILQLQF